MYSRFAAGDGVQTFAYLYTNLTMKIIGIIFFATLFFCINNASAQNPQNWTSQQLIQPSELASILKTKNAPVIFSVGPAATIPNSIEIGMVKDKANLDKFKKQLSGLPKKSKIVVYCGCCPYEHCPNVRPAIDVLNEMKFTNYSLLNLPHNIKTDWIDKGFPTEK
ncbi:MAG TPA: rhodanese-like domain-containing protein [Chitinophagaceae bacterium]